MNRYAQICTDMHRYAQKCTDPALPHSGPTASCASWRYWDNPLLHARQEGSMLWASRDRAAAFFTSTRGPTDYNVAPEWPVRWPFAVCDSVKTMPPKGMRSLFRCSRNPLLDMHKYTQILAHIHRYQQILTSKKTKASLCALSGFFTWAYSTISCPETARTGENITSFDQFVSIYIWSYKCQEYSHEHIVNF